MGEPIKIVVTAETQQAAAALEAFVKNSGAGLKSMADGGANAGEEMKKLREASLLTREGLHGIENTALMLGGSRFPELASAVMEARLAMMSTRTAAMLLGTSLTAIIPWMAMIAASVAGGVVLWESYGGGMETAEHKAKRLGDELKKIPDLLANIAAAQKGGSLSAGQADAFRSILSGATPIYHKTGGSGPGGDEITTEARSMITTGRQRGNWRNNSPADINNPDDLKGALAMIQKQTPDENRTEQIKAQNEIDQVLRRSQEEALSGITKERQAQADKYAEDKQKILDEAVIAKTSKEKLTAELAQLDANYAGQKQKLDEKESAEKGKQIEEWMKKQGEIFRSIEKHDKDELAAAEKKSAELAKQAQLRQTIARANIEAQLASVAGDPFLTKDQKQQQSIPLTEELMQQNDARIAQLELQAASTKDASAQLEAEKQITDLKRQQAVLGNELARVQNPWATTITNLKSEAEITMTTLATTFANVFNAAIASISSGITGLIMGTKTWAQALYQIGNQILNEIISAIVSMGVRWVVTQLMMAMMGRSILAASVAATLPIAAAQSAIWAVPATLSTIASYGAAAAAAPGEIAIASAATLGLSAFADGGYTGAGGKFDPAGIVHKGEYVFDQVSVDRIGLGNLETMHKGGGAPASAAPGGKSNVSVYSFTDPRQMADHLQRNDDHEAWVVDVMSRNIHKFR